MNKTQIAEVVKAVVKYQANPHVHSLTCGNNSNHELLQPIVSGGEVHLWCLDCDYVQKHIPAVVIKPEFRITETQVNESYRIARNALNDWAGSIPEKDRSYVALNFLYKAALAYAAENKAEEK